MRWIHAVIDVPAERYEQTASFWQASLGWALGQAWHGHPELASFEPPGGDAYVHLQRIDGPPRIHIDLEVEDVAAARDHWAQLGARVAGPPPSEHTSWQAMTSPGGLPFCLVPRSPHGLPGPVEWPTGHRSRLVQVSIDMPADRVDRETAFWRAGLQWDWKPSDSPEFLGKLHHRGDSPIQLLFQRLGEGSGPVRAHLDLGTTSISTEVERQRTLGAELIRPDEGFVALRDPAGLAYCVTGNSPGAQPRRDVG